MARAFLEARDAYLWVVVGGLIIGTISNGLNMLRIQTFYQLVVMGSLIIIAVSIDGLIGKGK